MQRASTVERSSWDSDAVYRRDGSSTVEWEGCISRLVVKAGGSASWLLGSVLHLVELANES